jgi:hypothetical protein
VTSEAIVAVLSCAGELRSRDIHAAVQAMCDEPVPLSSVENCLARSSRGTLRSLSAWGGAATDSLGETVEATPAQQQHVVVVAVEASAFDTAARLH